MLLVAVPWAMSFRTLCLPCGTCRPRYALRIFRPTMPSTYASPRAVSLVVFTDMAMLIEANAARVIKAITNTPLDIPEGAEVSDVCKAVEEMMNESEERGELSINKSSTEIQRASAILTRVATLECSVAFLILARNSRLRLIL